MEGVPLLPAELTDEKCGRPFSEDSREPPMPLGIPRRKHRRAVLLGSLASSLATASVLIGLGSAWIRYREQWSGPFIYDAYFSIESSHFGGCGTTVKEAISNNCRFDELSDLWLPQSCSHKYEREYLQSNDGGPFLYWTDPSGKNQVSNRSQYAGGATYYSSTRDHLKHCEFNLYRFADSLETGERVGHRDAFSDHMHHCAMILSKYAYLAPDIDNIDVDTVSTFGFC